MASRIIGRSARPRIRLGMVGGGAAPLSVRCTESGTDRPSVRSGRRRVSHRLKRHRLRARTSALIVANLFELSRDGDPRG